MFAWKAEQSSRTSQAQADRANHIAIGQAETEVRAAISSARRDYHAVAAEMEELVQGKSVDDLDQPERRLLGAKKKRLEAAVEEVLNAYEDACGKYLDQKVDRARFKKSYFSEIRNLTEVSTGPIAQLMQPEPTSKFRAIWRVYREWYDLEAARPGGAASQ